MRPRDVERQRAEDVAVLAVPKGEMMKMTLCTAICAAALVLAAEAASADPWKDESGKWQWRGSYGWQGDGYAPRRYRQAERIPTRSSAASWRMPGLASWHPARPPAAALQMLRNARRRRAFFLPATGENNDETVLMRGTVHRHHRSSFWSGRGDTVGRGDTGGSITASATRSLNGATPPVHSEIFRLDLPRRRGWVDPPPPR